MLNTDLQEYSHRRYNPLTGEWVLVSPHRAKRPWQGQEEEINTQSLPSYDKDCYLCSGNSRAGGKKNPDYQDVFVFENDFAALQNESPSFAIEEELFKVKSETGICKVICFNPDHSKSLANMSVEAIEKVIKVWQEEYQKLGALPEINYVQIFENKGAVMGCSNPHPHGQIWSQFHLPNEILKKDNNQRHYFSKHSTSLLEDYVILELEKKERIIFQNEHFVVLVPFWAIWPFETMIIPKKRQSSIIEMNPNERIAYSECISVLTRAYDQLFNCSFPYSSGIHQAPTHNLDHTHWHWHMSFYPPLLRSATVKKFMVGYEMFGMPQRDVTAETAAKMLYDLIQ
ncbi:UDP-glucose--hexose-1-phosphate uridylyltransferase [Aquimarina macrocephali]|uniref:UDP-glucose--hexose-1-phosphate uridylyltransferase n=1 Tax=Aquimarina macrocephali TaxID=666563 RepID=UPI000466002A|nr:UDP-glucose--hexose-1-phosphate uridylyltransferase [Aquimarina macrocephali]